MLTMAFNMPGTGCFGRSVAAEELLAQAKSSENFLKSVFACVIGQRLRDAASPLIRGLSEEEFQNLLFCHFPVLFLDNGPAGDMNPYDEYDDLLALLMQHSAIPGAQGHWLAHAIATAAMGDNHLWEDMGLSSRAVLSRLMTEYFPTLAARNSGNMKWKKFFYRQLCELTEILICKSPNCADCSDYNNCFDPEDERAKR